jgi:hypothetical protein
VRAILEHFHIVIRFEHEHVGRPDSFEHQPGGMAEVGEKTEVTGAGANEKTDRILGVMRDAERFHQDIADLEAGSGLKHTALEPSLQLVFGGLTRGTIAINGDLELSLELHQTRHMIGVFMGYQDAAEFLGGPADSGESLSDLAEAEPGVDQQAGLIGLEVSAITRRPAAKDGQPNSHG